MKPFVMSSWEKVARSEKWERENATFKFLAFSCPANRPGLITIKRLSPWTFSLTFYWGLLQQLT